jgi:hypothetical protein
VKESLYESERLNGTTRLAMCIECGRMFTSDTNFDRHRMGVEDRYCVDPATKGLELDDGASGSVLEMPVLTSG